MPPTLLPPETLASLPQFSMTFVVPTARPTMPPGVAAAAGDGALYHDIPDLRVLDDAEQTRVLCGDVQSGDGVALSVEAAGELVRAHADGREGKAAEINVVRQDGADLRAAARRDGVGQPRQLLAAFDLVGRGLRARAVGGLLRRAVPRAGRASARRRYLRGCSRPP